MTLTSYATRIMLYVVPIPRLATISGVVIAIFFEDHNPPHVHVSYAEHSAKLVIADGSILAGSLPSKQLQQAVEWLDRNRAHAIAKWNEFNP